MTPLEIPEGCVPTTGDSEGYGPFTCTVCKETWTASRPDEEVATEFFLRHGRKHDASDLVVCHDCFMQLEYYREAVSDDDMEMPEA